MRSKSVILYFVTAIIGLTNLAYAETITLKSGEKVEGRIAQKTKDSVIVVAGNESKSYSMDDIERIEGEDVFAEPMAPPEPKAQAPAASDSMTEPEAVVAQPAETEQQNQAPAAETRPGDVARPPES
jgi:hypothetical protein